MSGSATIASIFAQRVVVGVGDMAVSNNQGTILSTYALGSCIGVIAFDPVARCGGILHLMLPEASVSPQKALTQPAMFADTGLPLFFKALVGLRAERNNLRLFVTGGASVMGGADPFRIGERNTTVTMNFLTANRLQVLKTDTGSTISRTVHLELSTGLVNLITPVAKSQLTLAA
ncbi:MAG: chemotaxis protein CheD [Lacunisphaera sp.]